VVGRLGGLAVMSSAVRCGRGETWMVLRRWRPQSVGLWRTPLAASTSDWRSLHAKAGRGHAKGRVSGSLDVIAPSCHNADLRRQAVNSRRLCSPKAALDDLLRMSRRTDRLPSPFFTPRHATIQYLDIILYHTVMLSCSPPV
jgi:hypothetical protein